MNQRQRRRKKKFRVSPDELHPNIAAGLTQGLSKREALEEHPVVGQAGVDLVSHMREEETVEGTRVPSSKFVAEDDLGSVWLDEPTGRLQRNVVTTFRPETISAMRQGMICIRCLEPQDHAFPEVCTSPDEMGCTYPLKDRQIMDMAMEFQGEKHLGPAKPISEYLEEQQERAERAAERKTGIVVEKKFISPGAARERLTGGAPKEVVLPTGVRSAP